MNSSSVMDPADILIRCQDTPNPYAIKFVANAPFTEDQKVTVQSRMDVPDVPLARDLMGLLGVKQAYFFANTVTVTHDGSYDVEELKEKVMAVIRSRMAVHDVTFSTQDTSRPQGPVDRSHLSAELQEVESILDRTIRPGLQADGGDLEVLSYEDNKIKILYQGACGGCPSALMGTLDAIQSILRHELKNEDLRVTPV